MPKRSGTRRHTNAGSFEAFFEGWLVRQEHYLDELLLVRQSGPDIRDDDSKDLISGVLAHYQEYYDEKSRVAQRNVFLVFSPIVPYRSPTSNAPSSGLPVSNPVSRSSSSPTRSTCPKTRDLRVNRLKEEIKIEEREINHEQAKNQETVAAQHCWRLRRRGQKPVDGQISEDYMVINTWKSALESVVAKADWLRMSRRRKWRRY